ncbi:MAG: Na/Pi symporter [Pseudomonadota bacterium]
MIAEITGPLLGGLGVFFVGVNMLGSNLKKMTTRKLRLLFARFTSRDWQSAILGLVSGLVTQSTSVSAFIMAGLASSGLMTVRRALPVIYWTNAGCSLLVLIAVLDIKYFVFLLLFVSGMSVAFEKPYKYRFLSRALLGVGLLFFGLRLIQEGAAPLAEMAWVRDVLAASNGSTMLTFVIGAILTVITQTYLGVVLIGITMTKAGVFSIDQIIMLVIGAECGSGIVTWLLSSGARGTSKQLVMAQVGFNILAVSILITLFYVEQLFGISLLKALVLDMSSKLEMGVAYMVVFYAWGIPIIASALYGAIQKLLNRLWPPTQEEALAKIKFIQDHASDSPDTALIMVEKELMRLVKRMPIYMRGVVANVEETSVGKKDSFDVAPYHIAFENITREIGYTLSDISQQSLNEKTSAKLLWLLNVQDLLVALEQNLVSFAELAREPGRSQRLKSFMEVIVQSQEFLLMQAVDAFTGDDVEDVAILRAMTSESGDSLESVRKHYLEAEGGMEFQDKAQLHRLSGLYERTAWLLNRLSVLEFIRK